MDVRGTKKSLEAWLPVEKSKDECRYKLHELLETNAHGNGASHVAPQDRRRVIVVGNGRQLGRFREFVLGAARGDSQMLHQINMLPVMVFDCALRNASFVIAPKPVGDYSRRDNKDSSGKDSSGKYYKESSGKDYKD